ncbi:MAG TPA: hypothetical protein VNZ03_15860 [Terriglobales bacterium]|jgi:hypothetical protein|nr:hypothetical protein [Terriglobales bacterium]
MSFPKSVPLQIAFCLWLSFTPTAQPASVPSPTRPIVNNDFVQKQFGSTCSLIGIDPLIADLDSDGTEDIVIPARCTNPMMDQVENSFVVVDPYNSFFGYGNPKVTTQFASDDPERRGYSLLVIHGAGAEAWHSATPKAKFIIVNLPFKQVVVKKLSVKKSKTIMGIFTEETGGDQSTSVVFWDGKRYKYQPLGSSME